MRELKVQIIRFVDACQPGVVECEFRDANKQLHYVIDKVPIFTNLLLWSDSHYPQPGTVQCEILEQTFEENGRIVVKITTVESTRGETEFWIDESELIDG